MTKEFELIITIVKKGHSDKVVEATRIGGARGGTIIYGRGTSAYDSDSIMGIKIQPEKEVVFTLAESSQKEDIMKLICEHAKLYNEGEGLCFSVPVNQVVGSNKLKD